jgi:hypothetical protein
LHPSGLQCHSYYYFIFSESTVTGIYLDMPETFCFPQLNELENPDIMFQHDGAPPGFSNVVRGALNGRFPERRIGREGPILWLPRSPELTQLDFSGALLRTLRMMRKFGASSFKGNNCGSERSARASSLAKTF